MFPSTVNLWANNWRAYGSPKEAYPLIDILREHARHWYQYPHDRLSDLPPDRYQVVEFEKLVADPKKEIERIYNHFGFDLSPAYQSILDEETILSRNFNGGNNYSLLDMGLDIESIIEDFQPVLEAYDLELPLKEKIKDFF
jgi:hypothetical protein